MCLSVGFVPHSVRMPLPPYDATLSENPPGHRAACGSSESLHGHQLSLYTACSSSESLHGPCTLQLSMYAACGSSRRSVCTPQFPPLLHRSCSDSSSLFQPPAEVRALLRPEATERGTGFVSFEKTARHCICFDWQRRGGAALGLVFYIIATLRQSYLTSSACNVNSYSEILGSHFYIHFVSLRCKIYLYQANEWCRPEIS